MFTVMITVDFQWGEEERESQLIFSFCKKKTFVDVGVFGGGGSSIH